MHASACQRTTWSACILLRNITARCLDTEMERSHQKANMEKLKNHFEHWSFSKKCLIQIPNLNQFMGCEPVAMKLLGRRANYQHLCGHNGTSHSPFAPDTSSASHVSRHGIVIRCGKQSSTIIDMIWWLEMEKSQTLIIHKKSITISRGRRSFYNTTPSGTEFSSPKFCAQQPKEKDDSGPLFWDSYTIFVDTILSVDISNYCFMFA